MKDIVILKEGKERVLSQRHPWIFSGAVKEVLSTIDDGAFVDVLSSDGTFLCHGHYQKDESIVVKILSYQRLDKEEDYINKALYNAFKYREALSLIHNLETTAYRLVHGEGDQLPGLIIDVYNDTAVIQFHSAGMRRIKDVIVTALHELLGWKLSAVVEKSIEGNSPTSLLWGQSQNNIIVENRFRFKVDWEKGQKTGFYIDQRDNRRILGQFALGKKILNAFCYSGAFSVYALANGASSVSSVDSSESALSIADENLKLNFSSDHEKLSKHQSVQADCLPYLKDLSESYDLIILDPPAFIKHRGAFSGGIKGYKSINTHAMKHINNGGLLFTFSCSQLLSRDDFREVLRTAALDARRNCRIVASLCQSACHPVSIYHPEGEYLKGYVLEVN